MTNMNESMQALLERGSMALEDKEWDKANEYFDRVLNYDAKCGDAYLGQIFAENRCIDFDGFVKTRLYQYLDARTIRYEACRADDERINNIVTQYAVDKFLLPQQIMQLLECDRTFLSETKSRTEDYRTEVSYIKNNARIHRARQFLKGEKKDGFESALRSILMEMASRIEHAEQYDIKKTKQITDGYQKFITDRTEYIAKLSSDAQMLREKVCDEAYELYDQAETVQDYYAAADKFDLVGDYRDAVKLAAEARNKANEMLQSQNQAKAEANKKKTIKVCAGILIGILLIFAVIMVIGNIRANNIQEKMIGQTFTGTYHYSGSSYYRNTTSYTITIIDDKYCEVTAVCDEYTYTDGYGGYYKHDDKAKYGVTAGLFKIKFNWDSDEIYHSAESFVVEEEDGEITLYTENFNSSRSMTMSN